ncbi:MAG: hypothetical protein A2Y17_08700 [Clostridiales bacterium GWF2_38_85]|nr:MAG: hypothetical protein A2Y17_08700 [Clostridiales bacterium GWF2_38_85]HBL83726.1 LemA family protein [Clostridiales bacterium]
MEIFIGILILMVIAFLFCIFTYNSIIHKSNQIANSEGSINVMLKKRFNLIPNLVRTADAYMKHEKELFVNISNARYAFDNAKSTGEKLDANSKLNSSLSDLFAVAEGYPELKADRLMLDLMHSLNETEEQLSAARRFFNTAITEYNNSIMVFPSNIIAGIAGFKSKQLFQIDEIEKENVHIKY